jgi:hypothetical protein
MGLDCYWNKPNEKKSAPLDFEPPLCFEDHHDWQIRRDGWAMFRGKVFDTVVQQITGQTLYVEWMPPSTVQGVARKLEEYVAAPWKLPPSEDMDPTGWEFWTIQEIAEIARMFRAYGDAGYGLFGSW